MALLSRRGLWNPQGGPEGALCGEGLMGPPDCSLSPPSLCSAWDQHHPRAVCSEAGCMHGGQRMEAHSQHAISVELGPCGHTSPDEQDRSGLPASPCSCSDLKGVAVTLVRAGEPGSEGLPDCVVALWLLSGAVTRLGGQPCGLVAVTNLTRVFHAKPGLPVTRLASLLQPRLPGVLWVVCWHSH